MPPRSAPPASASALDAAGDERSDADAGDDQPLPPELPRGLRRAVARRPALRGGQRGPALRRHGALAAVLLRAAGDAVRLSARRAGRRSTIWREEALAERLDADPRPLRGAPRSSGEAAPARTRCPTSRSPPDALYLSPDEWRGSARRPRGDAHSRPSTRREAGGRRSTCGGAQPAAASPRSAPTGDVNVFDALVDACRRRCATAGRKVVSPAGARARATASARCWSTIGLGNAEAGRDAGRAGGARRQGRPASPCCRSKPASRRRDLAVIGEQDILGDRLVAPPQARKRAADFICRSGEPRRRRPRRPRRPRHRPLHRA